MRVYVIGLMIVVAATSLADTEGMDDRLDRAHVGQSSRSIGVTFTPSVELAFEQALAKAKNAAALTIEGLLLELLDEHTTFELLTSANVDVDALRADLNEHVRSTSVGVSVRGGVPKPEDALQNAIRRAVMKAVTSNKKGASGADIVVAILVEGDSFAAKSLGKYGLNVDTAEDVNLDRYLARSKEQTKLLREFQEKARTQRETTSVVATALSDKLQVQIRSGSYQKLTPESETEGGHATFVLHINSANGTEDIIPFKAAISRNGILDLYIEQTPYEIEFVADTVVGLFEAIEGGDRLEVQLVTEIEGENRKVSGFSGSAGAIFRDRNSVLDQKSGYLD